MHQRWPVWADDKECLCVRVCVCARVRVCVVCALVCVCARACVCGGWVGGGGWVMCLCVHARARMRPLPHLDLRPFDAAAAPRARNHAAQPPRLPEHLAQLPAQRRVRQERLKHERVHEVVVRALRFGKVLRRRDAALERREIRLDDVDLRAV